MAKQVPYTNTDAGLLTIAFCAILPGETTKIPSDETIQRWKDQNLDVDKEAAALLEALDKSPVVRSGSLRQGVIELPPPPARPVVNSLSALEPIMAKAQIRLCSDLATLGQWASVEDRADILADIKARIATLKS